MGSKAWKELEKHVAERLGGERLIKLSYSDSQPDVIVKNVSSALGISTDQEQVALIIECKYSIDQSWQRKIADILTKQPKDVLPLVIVEDIVFWDLEDTSSLIKESLDKNTWTVSNSLAFMLRNLTITQVDRKIPKYIHSILGQAACYTDWVTEAKRYIPMACLGQKGASKRIMLSNIGDLKGIPTHEQ